MNAEEAASGGAASNAPTALGNPVKSVVSVQHLTKRYRIEGQIVTALDDITFNIEEGSFLAVAGPSGSGKSTLLNIIGCIDSPTSGSVAIDGDEIAQRTPDELADLRARAIGFIFQTFNLFPVLNAAENVEYPLLKRSDIGPAERRDRVSHYLDIVGLADLARHRPNQLSGGQRQRVAIARALVIQPRIVLADEPTANLDHKTGKRILRLMQRINRTMRTTFVFSTHDQKVLDMADRRVDLEDGEIVRLGVRAADGWAYAVER
jgi:putative ABC transport system ATP-binding protein